VLTNKKQQTTRFVRSLVRGLQAFLRNLPTLIVIMSGKYESAAREGRNTEAREVLATLCKLRDPRNLLLAVGLAQLLELYTLASLEAQHSRRFPTQAWSVVMEMRDKVEVLGERWEWGQEELQYAGIEPPAVVKERLVEEGTYKPKVSEACARGNRVRKDTALLKEGEKVKDLFNEEGESVMPLAGEVAMSVPLVWRARRGRGLHSGDGDGRSGATRNLTEEDVAGVEEELQELAKDIVEIWLERQQPTSMEKAASAAFAAKFDWGDDRARVEDEGVSARVGVQHTMKMRELLTSVVAELSELQAAKFEDVDLMLEGFSSFLKFRTKEKASMQVEDHEIYRSWFTVRVGITNNKSGVRGTV
jgi:hypothetical protein